MKVTVNKKEEMIDEEDFVFPHSDTELLTEEDLQGKDNNNYEWVLMKFMQDTLYF